MVINMIRMNKNKYDKNKLILIMSDNFDRN